VQILEKKNIKAMAARRAVLFGREVLARQSAAPSQELTRPLAAVFASKGEVVTESLPAVVAAEHTPLSVAESAAEVARPASLVVARVGGEMWDMARPLPPASASSERDDSITIEFFDAASEEGQRTLWRTAARLLGGALEAHVGSAAQLCDAAALDDAMSGHSFYADVHTGSDGARITPDDFAALENIVRAAAAEGRAVERVELPVEVALEMFADNPFRVDALRALPAGASVAAYRCGDFVDVCDGPHVPNARLLGALSLQSCSGAHWQPASAGKGSKRGGSTQLQRVFGVAFAKRKQLRQWEGAMKEARLRDHRVIGKAQRLFAFTEYSPGSALMLPHGTRIYNTLVAVSVFYVPLHFTRILLTV
jgi:threonyl-tRNA synthetase